MTQNIHYHISLFYEVNQGKVNVRAKCKTSPKQLTSLWPFKKSGVEKFTSIFGRSTKR